MQRCESKHGFGAEINKGKTRASDGKKRDLSRFRHHRQMTMLDPRGLAGDDA
jgi:hypothetical protein